jgi:nucleoside-diphosphate-sugar epimerase
MDPQRNFWQDRPVPVTGATGLVGGWLTRRLIAADEDIVCLVRDWAPRQELTRSNLIQQVTVARGNLKDRDLLERTNGEYEMHTVLHLAAVFMLLVEQLSSRPELRGQAFNFSYESQVSVLCLVKEILLAMQSPFEPRMLNQASHEIRRQYRSAERARTVPGWQPIFSLAEGLARTIPWYRESLA